MLLGGAKIAPHRVVLLAGLLDSEEPLAGKLRLALEHQQTIVRLDQQERERLREALENAPPVFSDLKQALRRPGRPANVTLDEHLRQKTLRRRSRA